MFPIANRSRAENPHWRDANICRHFYIDSILEIMYSKFMKNKNNTIWCKHIKYWYRKAEKDVSTFVGLEDFPEAFGWSYIYNDFADVDRWNFCPICGIKRPN